MRRNFHLLIIAVFLFSGVAKVSARNVLGDILKIYKTYQEVNMALWLTGDIGAEKRFGKELQMWLRLSTKPEKDPKINAYVKGIFDRVVPHYKNHGLRYDVRVIQDSSANAFAIPGGHIYVHTGLLSLVSSDDELATVLAHELGHAERRHSLKNFRASTAAVALLNAAVKNRKDRETWGALLGYLTLMKFSREQEDEADDIGQFRMAAAGFNPAAQVTVWEKFMKKYGDSKGIAAYTSSHPPSSERIQNARNNLAKMNVSEKTVYANTRNILSAKKINLLPNSSFEEPLGQNGAITGWQVVDGKATISEKFAFTGRKSIELFSDARMSITRVLSDFIPVDQSSDFIFTGWMKSLDGTQNAAIGLELYDANRRLRDRIWAVRESSILPDKISRIEARLANAAGRKIFFEDTAFMRIVLQTGLISQGSVWFDDLRLKLSSVADPVNLLPGGDFETIGAGARPMGVYAMSDGAGIDFSRANTGHASMKLAGLNGGQQGFSFSLLPLNLFKTGTTVAGSFFFSGDRQIKGTLIAEFVDASGKPLERKLIQQEFEAEKDKWAGTSFSFDFAVKKEEAQLADRIQIKVLADIPAGGSLWLDNFVLR